MTVEDYHDIFRRTIVNFDINDGTWFGDHYLYLNDEDRRNSEGFYSVYDDMTKHEFTLTPANSDVIEELIELLA